jgi:hypothetical protein
MTGSDLALPFWIFPKRGKEARAAAGDGPRITAGFRETPVAILARELSR